MMQRSNSSPPPILSILSGKGGVGKTSVTLSLAHELCESGNCAVLMDMDFSNRGMSELLAKFGEREAISQPPQSTLPLGNSGTSISITTVKIKNNLYFLDIQPMPSSTLRRLEALSLEEAKNLICELTEVALKSVAVDVVVADCHGSRDVVSMATALLSDYVFVVSVPETNTFFGTHRLIRDLHGLSGTSACSNLLNSNEIVTSGMQCHLIFNMVKEGFTSNTLSYWYRKYFGRYFSDDDYTLLIPFDGRTANANRGEPFPTSIFHYSPMAEKIRMLVWEIFKEDDRVKISDEARFVGSYLGPFIRGRTPFLHFVIDEKIPFALWMLLLAVVFLASVLIAVLVAYDVTSVDTIIKTLVEQAQNTEVVAGIAAGWAFSLFLFLWAFVAFITRFMISEDMKCSGNFRNHGLRASWSSYTSALWIMTGGMFYFTLREILPIYEQLLRVAVLPFSDVFEGIIFCTYVLVNVICGTFAVVFLLRSIRAVVYRIFSGETIYRIAIASGIGLYSGLISRSSDGVIF